MSISPDPGGLVRSPRNYPTNDVDTPRIFLFRRDPVDVQDFKNFKIRDIWINHTNDDIWMLTGKTRTSGTWTKLTGGGTGGIITLTGSGGGGAVSSDAAGNVDLVEGAGISIIGTPGTNTITISASGAGDVQTLLSDDLAPAVVPNGTGSIEIFGGTGIVTSGQGPGTTITISATGAVAQSFPTDLGTAIPLAGALTIAGGTNINTVGAGSTVTVNLDAAINITSVSFDGGVNNLSAYQVGTWTPTISFNNVTDWTFGTQNGNYTRIGNIVYCSFEVSIAGVGAAVGTARLEGLPFIVGAGPAPVSGTFRLSSINLPANYFSVCIVPITAFTHGILQASGDNVGFLNIDDTYFGVNSSLTGTFWYRA